MTDQLSVLQAGLLHRYRIGPEIGRGGMAVVHRAEDITTQTPCAIKILKGGLSEALGPQRFAREVAIASRLVHPNVVPVIDSGVIDGVFYLVMPLVEGESLRERLRREIHLPVEEAVRIALEVTEGLAYAHRQGVVHRDIKPDNLLIQDGRNQIADFGLARIVDAADEQSLSTSGLALGTPAYMSPEQASGRREIDSRTDIYGVGCLLYEMLAGEPPFTGPTAQVVAARQLAERPRSVRIVRPQVPVELERTIERALEKVPADRYQSAADLRLALQRVGTGRGKTRRRIHAALGLVGLAIAGALGIRIARSGHSHLVDARFLVLPCRLEGSVVTPRLEALRRDCSDIVLQLFRGWRDLETVEPPGDSALSVNPVDAARAAGAGNLVAFVLHSTRDSTWATASLSRFGGTRTHSDVSVRLSGDTLGHSSMPRAPRTAAQTLFFPEPARQGTLLSLGMTSQRGAMSAVFAGDSLLVDWDLAGAKDRYFAAYQADPGYAAAKLRYVRASLWAGDPPSQWGPVAKASAAAGEHLDAFEATEARALVALSAGDYPEACRQYGQIVEQDSTSFMGWFGLAECHIRDTVVVRSSASPSGWRFRGSVQAAHRAYRRAMSGLSMSTQAFGGLPLSRMAERLLAQPGVIRLGVANNDPKAVFGAFPEFVGDTLVLIPYPVRQLLARKNFPPTRGKALAEARRSLLALAAEWVARYPKSAAARRAFILALELGGQIDDSIPGRPSALVSLRELRSSAKDSASDLELGATEVRLLLKARRYQAAMDTAARLVGSARPHSVDQGQLLAGLAALIGDAAKCASLMARFGDTVFSTGSGETVSVDRELAAEGNRLLAYAALGVSDDSVRAGAARLATGVAARVAPERRAASLEALLFLPRLLAYPVLPAASSGYSPAARLEVALQSGNRAAAGIIVEILAIRRTQILGEVHIDQALLEARLVRLAGDSSHAEELTQRIHDAWSELDTEALKSIAQAAAIRTFLSNTPKG